MAKIKVAGLDGSLRNFGVSVMEYDTDTGDLKVLDLTLVETAKSKNKKVRASSDNLERAQTLVEGVNEAIKGCLVCFGEVPSGGQSYDAVLGFGIVIGIYAGLKAPFIEVSPAETKKTTVGTRTASKEEMIAWAFETHPEGNWLKTKRNGEMVPTLKNEHLADATAVVYAGIKTPAFKTYASIASASISQAA